LTFNAGAAGKSYVITDESDPGVTNTVFRNIIVSEGVITTITLDGVSLTCSAHSVPVIELKNNAGMILYLSGTNSLRQIYNHVNAFDSDDQPLNNAGIAVPASASLTIDDAPDEGIGSLIVEGGVYSAGIGGGYGGDKSAHLNGLLGGDSGAITIIGGEVTAGGDNCAASIGGGFAGAASGIISIGGDARVTTTHNKVLTGHLEGGAGIGDGSERAGGTIIINGGTVTASGINGGAGIGSGCIFLVFDDAYPAMRNTITINGGTVTATGGGGGGAAIGGGAGNAGGIITISGGTVTATNPTNSSRPSTGIGGGGSMQESIVGDGGNITITGSAVVTAVGASGGAGIGGGGKDHTAHSVGSAGGEVTIGGTAKVTATSEGTSIYPGAGIGGGYEGDCGTITIQGSAKVTAKGGNDSAGIGCGRNNYKEGGNVSIKDTAEVTATGGYFTAIFNDQTVIYDGAGIGPGRNGTIHMDATATVRAYAYARRAIEATTVTGSYFVDAVFYNSNSHIPSKTEDTKLPVYAHGTTLFDVLTLPKAYRGFAYSTKNLQKQEDDTILVLNSDGKTVRCMVGYTSSQIVKIPSQNSGTTNIETYLRTISAMSPKAEDRTTTSAFFTHNTPSSNSVQPSLNKLFKSGGYRYSLDSEGSGSSAVLLGNIVSVNTGAPVNDVMSTTAYDLEPNTQYYVDLIQHYDSGITDDPYTLITRAVPFTTKPLITSASAIEKANDTDKLLVDADFHVSRVKERANNVPITGAAVYWGATEIDEINYSKVDSNHKRTLTKAMGSVPGTDEFTDTGFTGIEIPAKDSSGNATKYIFIVLTNEVGDQAFYTLTYSNVEINVTVPTKLFFAAFASGGGTIVAPNYYIQNNGETKVEVTLDSVAITSPAGLTLTSSAVTKDYDVNLYIQDRYDPSSYTENLAEGSGLGISVCTIKAMAEGGTGDPTTYDFTLAGTYKGPFDEVKRPEYQFTFKFEIAD
jgi:hypothetical protein